MQSDKPKSAIKSGVAKPDIWNPATRRKMAAEKRLAKIGYNVLFGWAAFNSLTFLEDSIAGLNNLPEYGVVRAQDGINPLTTIPLSFWWNARINIGLHELRTHRHIQQCTTFRITDPAAQMIGQNFGSTPAELFLIGRSALGIIGTAAASLFNGLAVGVAETMSQGSYGNINNPCASPVSDKSVYGTMNYYFSTAVFDGGPRF